MTTGEIRDIGRGGDKTFDFLCVVCKGKNKNTEADKFCSECHDYYCSSCVKCHDVIPALKNHQILDKSTAPLPAVPTERCKEHKDKPIDMYCQNHNVVGCSTCMLNKHSSCKEKVYIPEFIKDNTKATNSNNIEEQMAIIAKSLNQLQQTFVREMEELKGNKDNVIKEIGTFREKINELLDRFEKSIVQQLERWIKTLNDKIDSNLVEIHATTIEIKAAQDHLKSAGKNMPQKFISIMQANQLVSNAEEKVRIHKSHIIPTELDFIANKKLQTLFSEIQDLGSFKVREKLKITGRQKYPVKVKSDSEICHITSACTPNDDTIILADWNNSKLKLLDSSSFTVRDCCDIPPRPWQVCGITDAEVAVSCWDSQLIQFVNVGRTMKKTRQIKTEFLCKGLAYTDERVLVSDSSSVYVFSLSGKQLQQLYKSVGLVFSIGIQALAINSDKSRIYVADHENVLIILDMNGQLDGQYNGNKLRGACHVCLDTNDNVLVCGRDSRNVLQLSYNGKLISEVLKTEGGCLTVCCNKKNSKMIVGCLDENKVEVYDISA